MIENGYDVSSRSQGYIRNAFYLSFYFLLRYDPEIEDYWTYALRAVIGLGGDTDTNACVVGAMMGALVGIKEMPSKMYKKVLAFDCNNKQKIGRSRPEFLSVKRHALHDIERLILCRPQKDAKADIVK